MAVALAFLASSAALTTTVAPAKPVDPPEQGPAAFGEAFREQAEDTTLKQMLAWLDTADGEATVPDVPDSPSLTAFHHELPSLSEYMTEGSCPKERAAVAGLGDSEDTICDGDDLTAVLSLVPDFSMYVAEGSCPKERVLVAGLGDSKDTVPHVLDFPNSLASTLSECLEDGGCSEEPEALAWLGDSEDTTLMASVPSSTADTRDELPDLSEYVMEGSCPKQRAVAARLGRGEDTPSPMSSTSPARLPPSTSSPTFCTTGQMAAATSSKWQR